VLKWFTYLLCITFPVVLGLSTYEFFNPGLVSVKNQSYLDTYYLVYEIFMWIVFIPISIFTLLISKSNEGEYVTAVNKKLSKQQVVDSLDQIKSKRPIVFFFSMLTPFELLAIVFILHDYSLGFVFTLNSILIRFIKNNLIIFLKRVRASYEEKDKKEAFSS